MRISSRNFGYDSNLLIILNTRCWSLLTIPYGKNWLPEAVNGDNDIVSFTEGKKKKWIVKLDLGLIPVNWHWTGHTGFLTGPAFQAEVYDIEQTSQVRMDSLQRISWHNTQLHLVPSHFNKEINEKLDEMARKRSEMSEETIDGIYICAPTRILFQIRKGSMKFNKPWIV